jgi:hypothetical protein
VRGFLRKAFINPRFSFPKPRLRPLSTIQAVWICHKDGLAIAALSLQVKRLKALYEEPVYKGLKQKSTGLENSAPLADNQARTRAFTRRVLMTALTLIFRKDSGGEEGGWNSPQPPARDPDDDTFPRKPPRLAI